MGWLYMQSMGVHRTRRDYLDAQFTGSTPRLSGTEFACTSARH